MKKIGKVLILSTSILVGSSSLSGVPYSVLNAEAASVRINQTYVTTANLNMRSAPGTKSKVLVTIPKGKTVLSSERSGSWYKVSYTYLSKGKKVTKSGWVIGSYLRINKAVTKTTTQVKTVPSQKISMSGIVKTSKTMYQTTANLNIRSGAGTTYKVLKTAPKGSIVSSAERKGSWYKITYSYSVKGKKYTVNGWVTGSYMKEYYQYTNIKGSYYFTNKNASLFLTPDTKKKVSFIVSNNTGFYTTQKIVNSLGQTWYKVSYKGKSLYIHSADIKLSSLQQLKKTDFITNKDTYLFSFYGLAHEKLVKIPKNTRLSTNLKVGDWYKFTYANKTGYIYMKDVAQYIPPAVQPAPSQAPVQPAISPLPEQVSPTKEKETSTEVVPVQPVATEPNQTEITELTETAIIGKTFVTNSNLNLRKAAGADSEILTVIPNSSFVFPTHKVSNGWYKVSYNDKTGYVSGEYIKEVITGDPMHREGYQFIDLRKPSKVTASQIDQYITNYIKSGKTSVLAGKGQAFINAGNKYGVNSLYLAAHAILESGYGTSNLSLGKYNLFGFGAYDAAPFVAAVRFATIEQNIDYIAQEIKSTYLNPNSWKYKGPYLGYSTKTVAGNTRIDANSAGMNFYYASDVKWGQKIAAHMQNILPYNKVDYDQASVNTAVSYPLRPTGLDLFPEGIIAIAKKDLPLTSQKGGSVITFTLQKDTIFEIVEKHNDYWIKVKVGNQFYWTNAIKLDRYKEFIAVKNLGRVNASSLNIRPTASTALDPISTFKLNEYVHLVLDATGALTMDSSKTWYNVKLTDGRIGWVSKQYIILELQ